MTDINQRVQKVFSQGVSTANEANALIVELWNEVERLRALVPEDRTEKQSSSRWLYLEAIAKQLNDAGIDRQKLITVIKENAGVNAQNDRQTLYLDYWRPVHDALYPEKSRLSKVEIQKVYEAMNNHCANTFGASAAWPDKFGRG